MVVKSICRPNQNGPGFYRDNGHIASNQYIYRDMNAMSTKRSNQETKETSQRGYLEPFLSCRMKQMKSPKYLKHDEMKTSRSSISPSSCIDTRSTLKSEEPIINDLNDYIGRTSSRRVVL